MPEVIGIIVLVLVLVVLARNIRVVPQGSVFIVENLGRYKTTWQAGLHFKIPLIEQVVKKISVKEQVMDFPPQPVITKDNVTMLIDSVVYMKVFDPKLYTYGIENPTAGIQNLTATTLRSIIGEMELDATLSSREEINAKMLSQLDQATDPWGISITRIEVKNIQPPAESQESMTKQMRAEREKRQTLLEAEAHRESVVSRAEGDKKAKILAAEAERDAQIALAEGRAKSIELVYQAEADGIEKLNRADISGNVLKLKGIEALKDIADGQATKIYMPTDVTSMVTSLGIVGDSFVDGKKIDTNSVKRDVLREAEKVAAMKVDPCLNEESSKETHKAAETTAYHQADAEVDARVYR